MARRNDVDRGIVGAARPLEEGDPGPLDERASRRFDQVPPGPRNVQWRADAPACS